MIFSVIFCALPLLVASANWNYYDSTIGGPGNWSVLHPGCNGVSQSPIDIRTSLVMNNSALTDVIFTNYDQVQNSFELTNNGHSVQLSVSNKNISITGAGLEHKYVLEQFHFHWGANDSVGSEHLVDGKAHSLEIHFVHYNADVYTSVSSAVSASNDTTGVAVLAVFVNVAATNINAELGELTTNFSNVIFEGNHTSVSGFALDNLLPDNRAYYRYSGSLTTPECTQAVVWTVFKQPININGAQMATFRRITGDGATILYDNDRPIQPLNGRVVYNGGTNTSSGGQTTTNTVNGSSQFSVTGVLKALVIFAALFVSL